MKKLLIIATALLFCTCLNAQTSPKRMGNQIPVTFDCPWNIAIKEGVRFSEKCPDPQVVLDVYYPKNDAKKGEKSVSKKTYPCILIIHGGGWSMGNEKKFAMMAAYLASKGYVVASTTYRLMPEYNIEDSVEDSWLALKWLKENAKEFGGNPEQIGVTGGSAGGHLTCLLATSYDSDICKKVFGKELNPKIQAAVPMAPVTDLNSSKMRRFRVFGTDEICERASKISPINYVTNQSAPMKILHSKDDPVVALSESENIKAAYEKCGLKCDIKTYPSKDHAFWNTKPVDEFRLESWNDALEFFDKILKNKK